MADQLDLILTDILDTKTEMDNLKKALDNLNTKMNILQDEIIQVKKQKNHFTKILAEEKQELTKLCDEKQANKIVISGVNCDENSDDTEMIKNIIFIFNNLLKLNCNVNDIDYIRKINNQSDDCKIVVKFFDLNKRNNVFTNKKQLRGQNIFINNYANNNERKNTLKYKPIEIVKGKIAFLHLNKILIDGKWYTIDEVQAIIRKSIKNNIDNNNNENNSKINNYDNNKMFFGKRKRRVKKILKPMIAL